MSNIVKGLCSYCVAVENIRHNILPSYLFHLTMFHRSTISLHIAFVKKGHWVTNRKTRFGYFAEWSNFMGNRSDPREI